MKKVVFSVKKLGRNEDKISGTGYITSSDLIASGISKNGKSTYVRIFEDCLRMCHPVPNRPNEYSGYVYEIHELPFETRNGSTEMREVTLEYQIWYKIL